ncbi:acetyl-CoA carboxylase biotin carboxylase subunit family protein [Streptomyces melanogenes]|uniref:acetyl-CoA carboxylase biotin carboxylase subunit family protein n=1 Tax=Streptomyces melanogenes TaxID=67326 RepID=UPI0037B14978
MSESPERPKIILFDGPGGPPPEWFLPRLCRDYEIHILWVPSAQEEKDRERSRLFDAHCSSSELSDQRNALEEIVDFARGWDAAGILGFSELAVTAVHTAALRLGLPSNTSESLRALRDKHQQREFLAAAGVPVPRFASVHSLTNLRAAADHVGTPAVLKPAAGVGSMATYRVTAGTDLAELWKEAAARYEKDPRGSGTAQFVLEELLIGENWHGDARYGNYASVESLVADGRIHHLGVTDKFPLSEPFRENGGIMPSVLPDDRTELLLQCASQAVAAMGITNSAVHTEIMLTADGPRVIEVNSRIGGGVTEMLHHCYDFDVIQAMAAVATGRPVPTRGPLLRSTAFCVPQSPAADVVLAAAPALKDLLALDVVDEAELSCEIGGRPQWERGTSGGTLARIVAVADSPAELLDLADYLASEQAFSYRPRAARVVE